MFDVTPFNQPPPLGPALREATLGRLWEDLASNDSKLARQAVWALEAVPGQAIPLFRTRLRPIPTPTPEQLRELIADLDSSRHLVRERASTQLAQLNRAAAAALRKALNDKPSAEVRRRLGELRAGLRWPISWPETLRTLRAFEVLEYIGGEEAKDALRTMARGAPEATETEDAKATLARLETRSKNRPGSTKRP